MASTYTSNLSIEKIGSGDDVGTWDTPTNSNWSVADLALGTLQQIDLSGGSITLSTAQTRSAVLSFIGNLTGSVTVSIPSLSSSPGTVISGRIFTVHNRCANSSAYTVTIQSTVSGQQVICAPPGDATDIMMQGTNSSYAGSITYRNLEKVGSFWDYAGSSVPSWVSGCTVPPYLNCDGTIFSSATYPILSLVLAGTTLPDARGRARFALNQGQNRINSGSSFGGVNGNTNLASGGSQTATLISDNLPTVPITDPGHNHGITSTTQFNYAVSGGVGTILFNSTTNRGSTSATQTSSFGVTQYSTTGITAGNANPTNFSIMPPSYVGGLTLIRSA